MARPESSLASPNDLLSPESPFSNSPPVHVTNGICILYRGVVPHFRRVSAMKQHLRNTHRTSGWLGPHLSGTLADVITVFVALESARNHGPSSNHNFCICVVVFLLFVAASQRSSFCQVSACQSFLENNDHVCAHVWVREIH